LVVSQGREDAPHQQFAFEQFGDEAIEAVRKALNSGA